MCQTAYHPLTTRVIAERAEAHLLYLECRHCGSAVVAVVTADRGGLSSVGAVTDLTSSEVIPLSVEHPITTDDVLDLYGWFERQPSLHHILRSETASS